MSIKRVAFIVGGVLVGALVVMVVEKKTQIFSKLFSKIPGLSGLL